MKDNAIPEFDRLHSNCIGIFAFDNSQNHHAMAPDALCVSRMNLSDGGKNIDSLPKMRHGYHMGTNQDMNLKIIKNAGLKISIKNQRKGVKRVLTERNLWRENLRLSCSNGCPEGTTDCCARTLLANQDDFKNQRIWLQEVAEDAGHQFIFIPKFHCEFNYIEMWWAEAKRLARIQCDYSFQGLKDRVPQILDSIPLEKIRRFARKCERYMDCYRRGLPPKLAEYACKKYRSHRRIPGNITNQQIEAEYNLKQ